VPYLIDTNWLIDHLAGNPPARQLLDRLASDGEAMSIVSYMELFQGVIEATEAKEARSRLSSLVALMPILPFTQEVAETCAHIRSMLKSGGRRIRPRALDLMIAATAIANGLTLVTQNTRDYSDIPGLRLYQAEES
jgi:predicted nucleic acid-binding protein